MNPIYPHLTFFRNISWCINNTTLDIFSSVLMYVILYKCYYLTQPFCPAIHKYRTFESGFERARGKVGRTAVQMFSSIRWTCLMRVLVNLTVRLRFPTRSGLVTSRLWQSKTCSPCFGHMNSSKASKRPPNEIESCLHKAAISDPKNVRYVPLISTNSHDVGTLGLDTWSCTNPSLR